MLEQRDGGQGRPTMGDDAFPVLSNQGVKRLVDRCGLFAILSTSCGHEVLRERPICLNGLAGLHPVPWSLWRLAL